MKKPEIIITKLGKRYKVSVLVDDEILAVDIKRKILENVFIQTCKCGQEFVINSPTHEQCKTCKESK